MPTHQTGDYVEFKTGTAPWLKGERGGEVTAVACRRGRVVYTVRTDSGVEYRITQGNLYSAEESWS